MDRRRREDEARPPVATLPRTRGGRHARPPDTPQHALPTLLPGPQRTAPADEPPSEAGGRHQVVPDRRGSHGAEDPTELIPRQDSGRHHLFLPATGPARHRRDVSPTAVATAVGALVGACVFAVVGREMVDDAYITLAYARTLGLYGEWGVYPGVPANTATSPLNVLLLGGLTAVVRDAVVATGVLLAVTFAALPALLTRIGIRLGAPAWRAPAAGLALLATSPMVASTVGLESALAVVLTVAVAERVLARAPAAAGVLAGLLVLTRPDLGVVALVAVGACGRGWWRAALGATGAALPWFAWSWLALGSAVPDTLMVKAGAPWGPWNFVNGVELWWERFPLAVVLIGLPAVAGLVALPFWLLRPELRGAGAVLGLGALAHAVAMGALDVAPFHWYYAPSTGALTVLAALTAARASGPRAALAAAGAVAALALAATGSVAVSFTTTDGPPLTSNWATAGQYETIAAQLPRGATIESPGEVGTLAYYCRCRVLDGLSDRGSIVAPLQARIASGTGLGGELLRLNYLHLDPVAPQQRDMRMATRVAGGGQMDTGWGPSRTWSLVPYRR